MHTARSGNLLAIRLEKGEDVQGSILAACREHGVEGGYVTAGIGMLLNPELGFFITKGEYGKRVFPGTHECLALNGNVALLDGNLMAHLHAICAHEDYSCFGGHLFAAKVGLTLEVAVNIVDTPVRMWRELEADSGLAGLLIN